MTTAAAAGLVSCHECGLLSEWHEPPPGLRAGCPRCRGVLHRRKPDAILRTSALLLAAVVLYVPANLLPIMTVVYTGQRETSTIVGGATILFEHGQQAVAILVLFASVTVPVVKMLGLAWMIVATARGSRARLLDRSRLYRLIEVVGRWSMLDLFMISILVALVKLRALATIEAEPGGIFFAVVVVLTMLASATWDPRLAWDAQEDST